jgi:hypothetical protein
MNDMPFLDEVVTSFVPIKPVPPVTKNMVDLSIVKN